MSSQAIFATAQISTDGDLITLTLRNGRGANNCVRYKHVKVTQDQMRQIEEYSAFKSVSQKGKNRWRVSWSRARELNLSRAELENLGTGERVSRLIEAEQKADCLRATLLRGIGSTPAREGLEVIRSDQAAKAATAMMKRELEFEDCEIIYAGDEPLLVKYEPHMENGQWRVFSGLNAASGEVVTVLRATKHNPLYRRGGEYRSADTNEALMKIHRASTHERDIVLPGPSEQMVNLSFEDALSRVKDVLGDLATAEEKGAHAFSLFEANDRMMVVAGAGEQDEQLGRSTAGKPTFTSDLRSIQSIYKKDDEAIASASQTDSEDSFDPAALDRSPYATVAEQLAHRLRASLPAANTPNRPAEAECEKWCELLERMGQGEISVLDVVGLLVTGDNAAWAEGDTEEDGI